jgi:hypothetical protein
MSRGTPSPSVRRSRSIFWRRRVLVVGMTKDGEVAGLRGLAAGRRV